MNRTILIAFLLIVGCSRKSSEAPKDIFNVKDHNSRATIDLSFGELIAAIASTHQEMVDQFEPTSSGQKYAIETKLTEWIELELQDKIVTWNCRVTTVRKEFLGEQLLCYVMPEVSPETVKSHGGDPTAVSVSFDVSTDQALRLNDNDEIVLNGRVERCSLDGMVIQLADVTWKDLP